MKRAILIVMLVTIAGISSFAQNKLRYVEDIFTSANVSSDIIYGNNINATGQAQDLLLDLYQPAGDTASSRLLIIMAHEGSFIFGDKTDTYMVDFANRMVKKGYVIALITYRKGWVPNPSGTQEDNTRLILPAAWRAVQDVKTCTRFFKKNATTYKIDSDHITAGGFGAGAYLPINGQIIDLSSEFNLASLQKKNAQGQPSGEGPYIDTTKADLGGIYDTKGGHPGYSFQIPVVLIYSGAVIDTLLFDNGVNPKAIAAHGDKDETTPYKTAVVNAQAAPNVLVPIIKVHGTYQITRVLDKKGVNTLFNTVDYDKFPQFMIPDNKFGPLNMYKKGVYTFVGQTYMPWDQNQEDYKTTYSFFMDTLVRYTAPRLALAQGRVKLSDVGQDTSSGVFDDFFTRKAIAVYPNPASGEFYVKLNNFTSALFTLKIYDAVGQEVYVKKDIRNAAYSLSGANLPKGVYFVRVEADGLIKTEKLLLH